MCVLSPKIVSERLFENCFEADENSGKISHFQTASEASGAVGSIAPVGTPQTISVQRISPWLFSVFFQAIETYYPEYRHWS